jgi:hypothetical protein
MSNGKMEKTLITAQKIRFLRIIRTMTKKTGHLLPLCCQRDRIALALFLLVPAFILYRELLRSTLGVHFNTYNVTRTSNEVNKRELRSFTCKEKEVPEVRQLCKYGHATDPNHQMLSIDGLLSMGYMCYS